MHGTRRTRVSVRLRRAERSARCVSRSCASRRLICHLLLFRPLKFPRRSARCLGRQGLGVCAATVGPVDALAKHVLRQLHLHLLESHLCGKAPRVEPCPSRELMLSSAGRRHAQHAISCGRAPSLGLVAAFWHAFRRMPTRRGPSRRLNNPSEMLTEASPGLPEPRQERSRHLHTRLTGIQDAPCQSH